MQRHDVASTLRRRSTDVICRWDTTLETRLYQSVVKTACGRGQEGNRFY